MRSTRPVEVVLAAALDDVKAAIQPLRVAGWPAALTVEAAEADQDHFYDVVVRIRIGSPCVIPVESLKAREV